MGKDTLYRFELRPITALSINTGNVLDYVSYYEEGNSCVVIDVDKLISRVFLSGSDAEKHALKNALDNSEKMMINLKSVIKNIYSKNDVLYRTGLNKSIKEKLQTAQKGNVNVNEIYRVPSNGFMIPVVPGSSVKGSIRTAFTGEACKKTSVIDDDTYSDIKKQIGEIKKSKSKEADEIESKIDSIILYSQSFYKGAIEKEDKARKDPKYSAMKALQISDMMPQKTETSFVSLSMLGNRMDKALPIVDAILGSLLGKESVFEGTLKLKSISDIPYPLTIGNIIDSCNQFSKNVFAKEAENLIDGFKKANYDAFEIYDNLSSIIKGKRKESEFIIKIGRFSQREYMTYSNDFRYVAKTSNGNEKWGSTRTVMNYDGQYVPMGWCLCTLKEIK